MDGGGQAPAAASHPDFPVVGVDLLHQELGEAAAYAVGRLPRTSALVLALEEGDGDEPVTADVLNDIYARLLRDYYGDVIDDEPLSSMTWARIPHFFSTPYYVYQYATCFASTARLMQDLRSTEPSTRSGGVERYLALLGAGGSGYPMDLLRTAGVDLSQPDTVRAVATELDMLVSQLETALK